MFAYLIYSTNRLLAVEGNEILINGINLCDQTPKKNISQVFVKEYLEFKIWKRKFRKTALWRLRQLKTWSPCFRIFLNTKKISQDPFKFLCSKYHTCIELLDFYYIIPRGGFRGVDDSFLRDSSPSSTKNPSFGICFMKTISADQPLIFFMISNIGANIY